MNIEEYLAWKTDQRMEPRRLLFNRGIQWNPHKDHLFLLPTFYFLKHIVIILLVKTILFWSRSNFLALCQTVFRKYSEADWSLLINIHILNIETLFTTYTSLFAFSLSFHILILFVDRSEGGLTLKSWIKT